MADDKVAALQEIAEEVRQLDESSLCQHRRERGYKPVIGEGNPNADIMLIGEAPGKQEAKTGRPFVGQAGKVLDELLATVGISREAVYITNVVKDRPPGNRDPRADEISLYAPFLMRQIDIIQPRFIVTLGRFAMRFILAQFDVQKGVEGKRISDLHGQPLPTETSYGTVTIIPLYHPAASFYNRSLRDTLEQDIQVLDHFTSDNDSHASAG